MILGIKGEKNSGKTTLIEEILRKIDGKVVVIKSSSKETFDEEGKDTWRYRNAGAEMSIIIGRKEAAIFSYLNLDEAILLAKKMHPELIIIEGYENVKGDLIVNAANTTAEEVLKMIELKRKKIEVFVDGKRIVLNDFMSHLFYSTIKAMVSSLKGGEGKEIDIIIND
ncbi:MAG: molybdopterin-guanine dinucleotide biosynthesis protein B [Thermoplasmata archaeon]|nr:molybdopterin-guanine dinucleotide biosynthesis protein B [Thermoplasmata archaeon]